jgi:hypothetical protein
MYVIRDKNKYRAKVRTKTHADNTGFTDGLLYEFIIVHFIVKHLLYNTTEQRATFSEEELFRHPAVPLN